MSTPTVEEDSVRIENTCTSRLTIVGDTNVAVMQAFFEDLPKTAVVHLDFRRGAAFDGEHSIVEVTWEKS